MAKFSSYDSRTPVERPGRNVFNLSHENKLTCDFGKLVPFLAVDCLPGDKFKIDANTLLRFAPLVAPVMHRVDVFQHYFFVPYRLLFEQGKWGEFITGSDDEGNPASVVMPQIISGGHSGYLPSELSLDGSLMDYLGYPTLEKVQDAEVRGLHVKRILDNTHILPFLAYQGIFNEYYRDENLSPLIDIKWWKFNSLNASETQVQELFKLRNRSWEKDYFTNALPNPQKGESVQIPGTIGSANRYAPVVYNPPPDGSFAYGDGHTALRSRSGSSQGSMVYAPTTLDQGVSGQIGYGDERYGNGAQVDGRLMSVKQASAEGGSIGVVDIDPNGNLWADLGRTYSDPGSLNNTTGQGDAANLPQFAAQGNTIEDLRVAYAVQRWLEKNARGGTRYVESLFIHWGLKVPDYRLDRPEYIGGGRQPVVISEVLQTSSTDNTSPQANMAGHGVSAGSSGTTYRVQEFGIIIGIMSVMPRTSYQQGIPRQYMKLDKLEFGWPSFAHLGEQPVYNAELCVSYVDDEGTHTTDAPLGEFGYQERYREYKTIPNSVHGDFRNTLEFWHMGRIFSSFPKLNQEFIEVANENTADGNHRIFAVTSEDSPLWVQMYLHITAVRPLPRFGVPGYSDHF